LPGAVGDTLILYGAQLEQGVEFSEYIKTTSSVFTKYTGDKSGESAQVLKQLAEVASSQRIIPLYVTTQTDIKNKCDTLGIRTPDIVEWSFNFLNTLSISEEIDALAVNDGIMDTTVLELKNNFNIAFFRGTDVNYLSNIMPLESYKSWAPPDASFVNEGDYLVGIRIQDEVIGMYWVTSNFDVDAPYYFPVEEIDSLVMSLENRPLRGLGTMGTPYYNLRGRGSLSYNTTGLDINASPIDEAGVDSIITVNNAYSDALNVTPLNIDRSGVPLKHKLELN